jgi:hypothetical protein
MVKSQAVEDMLLEPDTDPDDPRIVLTVGSGRGLPSIWIPAISKSDTVSLGMETDKDMFNTSWNLLERAYEKSNGTYNHKVYFEHIHSRDVDDFQGVEVVRLFWGPANTLPSSKHIELMQKLFKVRSVRMIKCTQTTQRYFDKELDLSPDEKAEWRMLQLSRLRQEACRSMNHIWVRKNPTRLAFRQRASVPGQKIHTWITMSKQLSYMKPLVLFEGTSQKGPNGYSFQFGASVRFANGSIIQSGDILESGAVVAGTAKNSSMGDGQKLMLVVVEESDGNNPSLIALPDQETPVSARAQLEYDQHWNYRNMATTLTNSFKDVPRSSHKRKR